MIYKNASERAKLKLHFCLLIFFLIVGHVAMIFGIIDPTITGYKADEGAMNMQMYDHHKIMMDMKNISNDNSTNMHMHH